MIKQNGFAQPIVFLALVVIVAALISPYISNMVQEFQYRSKEDISSVTNNQFNAENEIPQIDKPFASPSPNYQASRVIFSNGDSIFEYDEKTKKVITLRDNISANNFAYNKLSNTLYYLKDNELTKFEIK